MQRLPATLTQALWLAPTLLGLWLHYLVPQMRKQLPWLCLAHPVLRSHEHHQFEVSRPSSSSFSSSSSSFSTNLT